MERLMVRFIRDVAAALGLFWFGFVVLTEGYAGFCKFAGSLGYAPISGGAMFTISIILAVTFVGVFTALTESQ